MTLAIWFVKGASCPLSDSEIALAEWFGFFSRAFRFELIVSPEIVRPVPEVAPAGCTGMAGIFVSCARRVISGCRCNAIGAQIVN